MSDITRRDMIKRAALAGAAASVLGALPAAHAADKPAPGNPNKLRFGLVTYLWGQDWDLSTLLANCDKAGLLGVELRSTHKHGVEPTLSADERKDVRKRFADSRVMCLGPGSNERFDSPDPAVLAKSIETSKAFIKLSHDIGSSGVKVKPDRFYPAVPREKTIEQIGKSLNELGKYAADFGQQVRLEVHGQCAELPTIKAIMDVADHPSVAVCWNSNPQDLLGEGLAHNLGLVIKRFGATMHVHELDDPKYPYADLFKLLAKADYQGWALLEASSKPADRVQAMIEQREMFERLIATAKR